MPIIPHFSSECLEKLGHKDQIKWPKIDDSLLIKKEYKIVVQINGKKKDLINVKKQKKEEELIKKIYENEKISKLLKDVKIKKTIYVKNKLINLIV